MKDKMLIDERLGNRVQPGETQVISLEGWGATITPCPRQSEGNESTPERQAGQHNSGRPWSKPGVSGEAVRKGAAYPGEHAAIVDRALWNRVHATMQESLRRRAPARRRRRS